MYFKTATDRLLGPTLRQLAEQLGIAYTSIRAARLPSDSVSRRSGPEGWERVIARIARRRARELDRLADELER